MSKQRYGFFAALFFAVFFTAVSLSAQETAPVPSGEDNLPVPTNTDSADTDNPGMPYLDLATEEKLKAKTSSDLGKVIGLCRKARKEGLSGENLTYCDQLSASAQLQRGLLITQGLIGKSREAMPKDWETAGIQALADLEEAVKIIPDHPLAFLRIAQLQKVLPNGDEKRAASALDQALDAAQDDQIMFLQVLTLKAAMEKDPKKREEIIAQGMKVNTTPTLLLLHAVSLAELKEFDKAIADLRKVLEQEPGNERAFNMAITILTEQKKFEEALQLFDAQGRDNDFQQRVNLLLQMRKPELAVLYLDKQRAKQPENMEILLLRSQIRSENKEYEEALKDIDTALRIRPDDERFLFQKARILAEMKKEEDALKLLAGLIEKNPKNRAASLLKMQILASQQKVDEAVAVIDELKKQIPEEGEWDALKIEVYSKGKEFDKALELTDGLIEKEPDEVKWKFVKAQVFVQKGDLAEAVPLLEELHQKSPNPDYVALMLIDVLIKDKKSKKAMGYLKPLLDKSPDNAVLLQVESQLMISTNQHTEAVRILEKLIQFSPNDETSLNNLSWLLSTSPIDMVRDGKRALELALKACELTQYKKAYILSTLAAAYAETGDFDKAVEWSQKSIDLSAEDENVSDRVEDLQKELDSYKNKKPFREAVEE